MSEPTDAAKRTVEHIFDVIATSYHQVWAGRFADFGARLAEQVPIGQGSQILDVGTGTGAVLLPMARRVGVTGRVIGVDLSNAMLHELVWVRC